MSKKSKIGQQLDCLFNQMYGNTAPTGKKIIRVCPIEAGLGKTSIALDALEMLYEDNPKIKTLYVTKEIEDANKLEKALGGIGLAVHSKKKDISDEEINNVTVTIITQSMFLLLCDKKNRNKRKYGRLIHGRHNLFVDEEFHPIKIIYTNCCDYDKARNSIAELDFKLLQAFDEIFAEVHAILTGITQPSFSGMRVYESEPLSLEQNKAMNKIVAKVESKKQDYRFFNSIRALCNSQIGEVYASSYYKLKTMLQNLHNSIVSYTSRNILFDNAAIYPAVRTCTPHHPHFQ